MINIDCRLLDDVTIDQLGLLCHILKRAGSDGTLTCHPSNKTLCSDTGWNIKKLQKVKSELVERGLLIIKTRKGKDEKQTSNWYSIRTDLMGIYIPGKKIDVLLQDFEATPKKDTHRVPQKRTGPPTLKTDNEVLTNSEVLFPEFNSGSQKVNVVSDNTSEQSEELQHVEPETKTEELPEKKAAADFPEYKRFIEIWMENYKVVGLRMPRDGAKVKSLIKLTRDHLSQRGVIPTEKNVVEFWDIFVKNLNRTWGHGKDLATIDSKYTSLIFEIENGKAITRTTTRPTDRFSDFAQ